MTTIRSLITLFLLQSVAIGWGARIPEHVPGTRVFIVPPPGYKNFPATQFFGNGEHYFHVIESIGENYIDSVKYYSNEKLTEMGFRVLERTDFIVSEYPAVFILSDVPGPVDNFMLSFGDTSRTIVISGTTQFKTAEERVEFIAALLLTEYDPLLEVKPYSHVRFIPDTVNTEFKLFRYNTYGFCYTINKAAPRQPVTFDPHVMILPAFNDKNEPLDHFFEGYIDGFRAGGFYAFMPDSVSHTNSIEQETFTSFGKFFFNDKLLFTITHIQQQNGIPLISHGICMASNKEGIEQVTEFCLSVKY